MRDIKLERLQARRTRELKKSMTAKLTEYTHISYSLGPLEFATEELRQEVLDEKSI